LDYHTVDEFVIDYTENISRGGAFIRTRRPLAPGTRLQLEINVTGVPVFMKMRGKVAWVNPPTGPRHRPDLPTGMGVRFIFPDEATRLMMEALVERLSPEHRDEISPEYLSDVIKKLRPDIQDLVRQRRARSPELAKHIDKILAGIEEDEEEM
jgi:type IV pilus assembly protein PilZ